MRKTGSFWLTALLLLACGAAKPSATRAQLRKPAPPPASVGGGSGVYHFNPDASTDSRTYNRLAVSGYLVGEIVVSFTPGKECPGSLSFWTGPNRKKLAGVVYVEPGKTVEIRENLGKFNRVSSRSNVAHEVYIGAEFGGIRFMVKPCTNSYTYAAHVENYERYVPPRPYVGTLGTSAYYDFRYRDYMRRHTLWGPTDYYKEFGEKYYNKFMNETYLRVSPRGKQFLKAVGKALQQKIEDKLRANPVEFAYLEMNDKMFKDFAFGTHPDAYCESGWGELDQSDRDIIIGDIRVLDVLKYRKGLAAAIAINRCVRNFKVPL